MNKNHRPSYRELSYISNLFAGPFFGMEKWNLSKSGNSNGESVITGPGIFITVGHASIDDEI